jgi:hypothetical protein
MFSGSIQFANKMEYDLCLFYKGEKLAVEHHRTAPMVEFSFLDQHNIHTIYLLITDTLTLCTQTTNTLQALTISPTHQYLCYQLQATRETVAAHTDDMLTWHINPYQIHDNKIPDNTLIFLFNPNLVAGLKVASWKPENMFRVIPTILIHPQATGAELERAMAIARLAALDVEQIHSKKNLATPESSTGAILTAMH